MPYIIKNTEVRLQNIGTLQEPHLYAITSGQNNHASLLFHCKIENDFHTMWINKVNKTSCNMGCVEKGCKAKHKFCVDEKFVKTIIGGLEREFGDLSFLEQFQEATIINYAFKFATLNSFVELIPANEAEVEINSDLGPDQTLPNFNLTVL